ncbi:MAG: hypothetical protein WD016_07055 [Balneolaceae bacterium]
MKAIEFKSKIKNQRIEIPKKFESALKESRKKSVRVILLIDDEQLNGDVAYRKSTQEHFLKGYADSDAVYDN